MTRGTRRHAPRRRRRRRRARARRARRVRPRAGRARRAADPVPAHVRRRARPSCSTRTIAERGLAVESSLVPFARGQQVITRDPPRRLELPRPDPHRRDVAARRSSPPSSSRRSRPSSSTPDWTPEAIALAHGAATSDGWRGLPQTVDGLVVVRDAAHARARVARRSPISSRPRARAHRGRAASARRARRRLLARAVAARRRRRARDRRADRLGDAARRRALARLRGAVRRRLAAPRRRRRAARRPTSCAAGPRTRSRTGSPARGSSATLRRPRARSRSARSRTRRAAASCSSCRACARAPTTAGGSPRS